MKHRIAIIGAGISGLTLAHSLNEHADIHVFEKARSVGGRMSTRYADPFNFDHGTQFFTARNNEFQNFLAPLIRNGLVGEWKGKVINFQEDGSVKDHLWFEPHYVAIPNMNNLCKLMAEDITVTTNTEVAPLVTKSNDGWCLADKNGKLLGVFDWVISTAPPVQTQRLFVNYLTAENALPETELLGCYTLMIGFNVPWNKSWIAAKVCASPLEWIAVNSTKPGRNEAVTSLVAHSSKAWAEAHIDDDINEVAELLRSELENVSGIAIRKDWARFLAVIYSTYLLLSQLQRLSLRLK